MRYVFLVPMIVGALLAQTPVSRDRQIEREFETIMKLLEPPADGAAPDEEESKERSEEFQKRLFAFLDKWTSKSEELGPGRFMLGKAEALAGRAADAARSFQSFVSRFPEHPDYEEARIAWGTALLDARAYPEAAKVLGEFLADPNMAKSQKLHLAQYYSALALIELDREAEALALLDQAVQANAETPIPADAAIQRIRLLKDLGRIEDAKAALAVLRAENADSPFLEALNEEIEWYGRPAPEFDALDGWLFGSGPAMGELRGQVVVLNFFALRYPACQIALRRLGELIKEPEFATVVTLGVTKDYVAYDRVPKEQQRKELEAGLTELGFTKPVAVASDFRNLRAYGVRGIPHTVVIGRDGNVRAIFVGASESDTRSIEMLRRAIRRELKR